MFFFEDYASALAESCDPTEVMARPDGAGRRLESDGLNSHTSPIANFLLGRDADEEYDLIEEGDQLFISEQNSNSTRRQLKFGCNSQLPAKAKRFMKSLFSKKKTSGGSSKICCPVTVFGVPTTVCLVSTTY